MSFELPNLVKRLFFSFLKYFLHRFRIKLVVSEDDVRKSYQRAMDSMARLNRTAARLMHKYNAHGSTDITGTVLLCLPF